MCKEIRIGFACTTIAAAVIYTLFTIMSLSVPFGYAVEITGYGQVWVIPSRRSYSYSKISNTEVFKRGLRIVRRTTFCAPQRGCVWKITLASESQAKIWSELFEPRWI